MISSSLAAIPIDFWGNNIRKSLLFDAKADALIYGMGKPDKETLLGFKQKFENMSKMSGKQQFLTYHMVAAHPRCSEADMTAIKQFASSRLRPNPEQVQIFTPTPSTYSTLMYYTEMDPWTRKKIFVKKDPMKKQKQKDIIVGGGK